jgi:alpha-mannosidase
MIDPKQQVRRRDFFKAAGRLSAGVLLGRPLLISGAEAPMVLRLEPTPYVLRGPSGPLRLINVRVLADGKPRAIHGRFALSFGSGGGSPSPDGVEVIPGAYTLRGTEIVPMSAFVGIIDFASEGFPLLIPEVAEETELKVSFDCSLSSPLENSCTVKPARKWSFFITPHTHFDVGFTQPQPVVFDRLTRDMDAAREYCERTDGWPLPSRYRWTVEVAGLAKRYIEGHSPEQVARFLEWVRKGRIEICGYYLNMPTEITGHEEMIRCLYYAQELRRRHNVTVDTVMIDDVPGYAWPLADLFVQAGIRRVSFRANSIRGRFLWYRPGAVPRPFYWEGPAGSRLFVWYTDTYRDGNFFRAPGLHEDEFVRIIQRNEQAGYPFDEVQLRMGGDNLPPEISASKNARDWNELYLWPQVTLATNREFLELLESRHSERTPVHRGDIPSWWAEGPSSAAKENGANRLAHDRLAEAEALWTMASLTTAGTAYPKEEVAFAYEQMIYFDEHTWGASESVERPKSENTIRQWQIKSAYAAEAVKRANQIHTSALAAVSRPLEAAEPAIAVWNTLGWPRTDVVELDLLGTPMEGRAGARIIDSRNGKPVACQLSEDRKKLTFIAREVPPVGHAIFLIRPAPGASEETTARKSATSNLIENGFYRVEARPETGGLASVFDKKLGRELLDRKAAFLGNQPIYEKPRGDRDAICNVEIGGRPVIFDRVASKTGRVVGAVSGPVFQDLLLETSLPTCPRILERVRLFRELKMIEISNLVTKEEVYEPESVYFAFPFDVPEPEFHCEIADGSMRPGKDQLTYSCQDYYAIQHWVNVSSAGFGITLVPIEAPLVMCAGLHAGKWADRISFDNGHVYSWVMNNYWMTNFCAAQGGEIPFRYRITSGSGPFDGFRATQFGWQPFYPLAATWLGVRPKAQIQKAGSLFELTGDPVLLSYVKLAETDNSLVLRLLEVRGRPANCTVRLAPGRGWKIGKGFVANVVEEPGEQLNISGEAFQLTLRPYEVVTIRLFMRAV